MDFSIYEIILAFLAAFLAGVINTLAGNGSVITLSIMTDVLAMDAGVANATNRVGIMFQTLGTTTGFFKNNMVAWTQQKWIIIICTLGALAGVLTVVQTSNENFLFVFRYMMIVILFVVLLKPEKWIKEHAGILKVNYWVQLPAYFVIGFYGGFIQMGAGIFMLAIMVLMSGYTIMQANVLKSILVMAFTVIVLIVFQYNSLIHWKIGLVMAAAQSVAGYLTARYASQWKNINVWAYRLLVAVIILAIISQFTKG